MWCGGAPPVLVGSPVSKAGHGKRMTLPHMSPPARIRSSGPPTLMVSASGPHSLPRQGVTPMGTSYGSGRPGAAEVEERGCSRPSGSASWLSHCSLWKSPDPGSGALAISSLSGSQCTSSPEGATAKGLTSRGTLSAGALQADGGGGSPPHTSLDLRAACSHGRPGAPLLACRPGLQQSRCGGHGGLTRPHPAPRLPPAFLWGGEQNSAAAQRSASFSW